MNQSSGALLAVLYDKIPGPLKSGEPQPRPANFLSIARYSNIWFSCPGGHPHLREHRYYFLRTSRSSISGQLIALGSFARETGQQERFPRLKEFSRPEIDSSSGLYSCTLLQNLASSLEAKHIFRGNYGAGNP